MGDPKELIVWQKAMDVVVHTYLLSEKFPAKETFGLTAQMRRAAISIPSNIAEGRRRSTEKEFKYFLNVAFGSAAELETQIEIALRLHFFEEAPSQKLSVLLQEVMRMLNKMISVIKNHS